MNRRKSTRPASPDDEALAIEVEAAIAPLCMSLLLVSVAGSVVRLSGNVPDEEEYRMIEARARQVPGVAQVVNQIQVAPVDASRPPLRPGDGLRDMESILQGHGIEREGPESNFTDSSGADFVAEAADEAEPYFPPTDIVVKPRRREDQGVEWARGFASPADTEPGLPAPGADPDRDDADIAEDVLVALEGDALTTDLDIRVRVRRGVVYLRGTAATIEEAEAAEAAATTVPGVVEVVEELTLS